MNKAFRIFKNNFSRILIFSLMILLPITIIQEFLLVPFVPELPEVSKATSQEMLESYYSDTAILWYFMGAILLSLFTELYRVGTIKIAYEALEERTMGISEIMDFSMRIWPKTILTTLLYALFVAFGFMLCFIPGVFMYVIYFLYLQIVVLTGIWGRKALVVSSFYTKKILGKIILVISLGIGLQFAVSMVASIFQGIISNTIAASIISVVVLFVGQFCSTYTDILAAVFVYETKPDIDIGIFKKKTDNNE